MTMSETSSTVDALNDLIETCRDGEYGFRTCAEHAKSGQLKITLQERSADCARAAAQLQERVRALGGEADTGGTAVGALHRGWVAMKTALSKFDDRAVLVECERGEDAALERYRDALGKDLAERERELVQRQYEGVQRNLVRIRALRGTLEARA